MIELFAHLFGARKPDWQQRLADDVERRRNSFEGQDYRRRREAAKLGIERRRAARG